MTNTTERSNRHPYVLAGLAGCYAPDNEHSPGARFLTSIADSVAEALEWRRENDEDATPDGFRYDGGNLEIADGAVPIYTAEVWRVFVDLGAWQEDPSELGGDVSDMEQAAKVCLYMIAERLVDALLDEANDNDEDEDEEGNAA